MDADNSQSTSDPNAAAKKNDDRLKDAAKTAGRSLSSSGQSMTRGAGGEASSRIGAVSYKKGGRVKRTGLARLHKGELVIPRGKVARAKSAMRKMKSSGRG